MVDQMVDPETPFVKKTVQAAVNAVTPGAVAVIEVAPGDYSGQIDIPSDKFVHLLSSSGASATSLTYNFSSYVVRVNAHSVISGFTISGGRQFDSAVVIRGTSGTQTEVRGCIIADSPGAGLDVWSYGNVRIIRSTIIGNGDAGIDVKESSSNVDVIGCILASNAGDFDISERDSSSVNIESSVVVTGRTADANIGGDVTQITADSVLGLRPDYHLTSNSIAVGAGVFSPGIDIDGSPFGDDAGADEFVDSDGDLLPDWFAATISGDSTAIGDPDGDTLSNLEEYEAETNPNVADTDGDFINDGMEVADGTNPLVFDLDVDPDGDGFTNRFELNFATAIGDPTSKPAPGHDDYDVVSDDTELRSALNNASDLSVIEALPGVYSSNQGFVITGGRRIHLFSRGGASVTTLTAPPFAKRTVEIRSSSILSGFTVSGGSEAGVYASGADSSVAVHGCVISGLPNHGIVFGEASGLIYRSTITQNDGAGIFVESNGEQIAVSSSIVAGNLGTDDFAAVSDLTSRVAVNSSIVGVGRTGLAALEPTVLELTQGADLGLTADFHLTSTSPARNAGGASIGEDMDGEPNGSDIGADEFIDTDGDAIPDWYELRESPLVDLHPGGDLDGDLLLNLGEYLAGASSILADTDGDTMDDLFEVNNGFRAMESELGVDGDGDGYLNAWELAFGTNGGDSSSKPAEGNTQAGGYFVVNQQHDPETAHGKASIAAAIDAVPIDTYAIIEVNPGLYDEGVLVIPSRKRIHLFSTGGAASTRINTSSVSLQSESIFSGFDISGVGSRGILVGGGSSHDAIIRGCVISGYSSSGIHFDGSSAVIGGAVERCTVVGNGASGVRLTLSANEFNGDVVIRGSIVAGNGIGYTADIVGDIDGGSDDDVNEPTELVTIEHSVVYDGRTGAAVLGAGVTSVPPQSALGLSPDFHISWNSPARNAGAFVATVSGVDSDGELPMEDGFADAGADEFHDTDSDDLADVYEFEVTDPDDLTVLGNLQGTSDYDGDGILDREESRFDADPFVWNGAQPLNFTGMVIDSREKPEFQISFDVFQEQDLTVEYLGFKFEIDPVTNSYGDVVMPVLFSSSVRVGGATPLSYTTSWDGFGDWDGDVSTPDTYHANQSIIVRVTSSRVIGGNETDIIDPLADYVEGSTNLLGDSYDSNANPFTNRFGEFTLTNSSAAPLFIHNSKYLGLLNDQIVTSGGERQIQWIPVGDNGSILNASSNDPTAFMQNRTLPESAIVFTNQRPTASAFLVESYRASPAHGGVGHAVFSLNRAAEVSLTVKDPDLVEYPLYYVDPVTGDDVLAQDMSIGEGDHDIEFFLKDFSATAAIGGKTRLFGEATATSTSLADNRFFRVKLTVKDPRTSRETFSWAIVRLAK